MQLLQLLPCCLAVAMLLCCPAAVVLPYLCCASLLLSLARACVSISVRMCVHRRARGRAHQRTSMRTHKPKEHANVHKHVKNNQISQHATAWNKDRHDLRTMLVRTCRVLPLFGDSSEHSQIATHKTAITLTLGLALAISVRTALAAPRCVIGVPCTRPLRATTGSTSAELELGRSLKSSILTYSTCSQL